ncbi:hypothetical protein K2173_012113 [Erythroxylum novogranatense]|uniref:Cupin type-1 domain-containing protein n=1 Tax=Erythroxylum novogranatense TaxID=1862640 RepID=A0AAV8SS61_9ROSI|nr:hypothetical protein K2173_012113 [Erythroxylum novogranatense]
MSSKLTILLVVFPAVILLALASDPNPIQDFCIADPNAGLVRIARLTTLPCKNSSKVTTDDFVFSDMKVPEKFFDTGLAAIPVNPTNFPSLNTLGMSFVRADLKVGAINPPHFHPRATEITYAVQGSVYSGFVDSNNRVMVFLRGLVHFQMNVGDKPATVFESFNSQNPGSQKIPYVIFGSGIDNELLEKAFGLSPKQIGMMRRRFDPKKV